VIIGDKVVNPGELRTQISLQSRTITDQTGGFQKPTWSTIAMVWSRWKNAHGAESLQAALVGAEAPATVLIRYRSGLDQTCAVLKGSERYEIISIDDIEERHEYQELKVKRMKAG
jgi:SPP1 family predicted phage head-tail adaptor